MLLRLWSSAKPECYNVKGLKRVLAAEGLHHMWLWISLMTQRQPHSVVSKKVQESNSSRSNTLNKQNMTRSRSYTSSQSTSTSPWSKYLYNSNNSNISNNSSDPVSGYTSDYYSSGDTSRPGSRQEQYNYYSNTGHRSGYSSDTGLRSGYISCPTTPVNNRKQFDFSFVAEAKKPMQSSSDHLHRSQSSSRVNSDRDQFSSGTMKNNSAPTQRQHTRSSSLSRLPKLAKLTSPKIVETEVWKKEIYKKVTEEVRDYSYSTPKPKLTKSGSLPILPNYITSIDIQVVPSRTIKFNNKQKKQSEHEKEILKLCGDIITELKPPALNIEIDTEDEHESYAKINKVSIKHSKAPSSSQSLSSTPATSSMSSRPTTSQSLTKQKPATNSGVPDKFISVKNVQIQVEEPRIKPVEIEIQHETKRTVNELPEVVNKNNFSYVAAAGKSLDDDLPDDDVRSSGRYFQSMLEQEEKRGNKFEIDDCMSSVDNDSDSSSIISSDVETVKSYNNSAATTLSRNSVRNNSDVIADIHKKGFGGGHFENLVNILQEAVKDISR